LVLDPAPDEHGEFHDLLASTAPVVVFPDLASLARHPDFPAPETPLLLREDALDHGQLATLATMMRFKSTARVALLTRRDLDDYIGLVRATGITRSAVMVPPVTRADLITLLGAIHDPAGAVGLAHYLSATIEMYQVSVATKPEKIAVSERLINHFATAGYAVHDLYDVRLILEENLNNALHHSFRTATGEEKYHAETFTGLDRGERVVVEYGSNADFAGFSVTDNAGTLTPRIILDKLQRHMGGEGLFDFGGRGLFLSRMLSSAFIITINPGHRTQVVALFDPRRRLNRPKPFLLNLPALITRHGLQPI
jgi:anti-sigma regulatory factor (Ser/Thr protein kinase)